MGCSFPKEGCLVGMGLLSALVSLVFQCLLSSPLEVLSCRLEDMELLLCVLTVLTFSLPFSLSLPAPLLLSLLSWLIGTGEEEE